MTIINKINFGCSVTLKVLARFLITCKFHKKLYYLIKYMYLRILALAKRLKDIKTEVKSQKLRD